jgi:hypothetical protein
MRVVVLITQRQPDAAVTPATDTNRVGSHDPLSDVCALSPQVADYIGQLCGIF